MISDTVLLVYNSVFLQNVFSKKEITDNFKVIFSAPENFEFYRSNFKDQAVFLILDETFAAVNKIRIIMTFDDPVIFVSDKLSQKELIRLYKSEIDDIITDFDDAEILLYKLLNIRHKYQTITNRYNSLKKEILDDAKKTVEIDSKSGLYNLDAFNVKAEQILKNNPDVEFMLIHLDLDRFKVFNDLYGFKTGDILLKNIGNEMNRLFSSSPNKICARVRAEHFVMLLEKDSYTPERILKYSSEFFENLYPGFYFNVRIGIYDIPSPDTDINVCIENSLLALISIKGDYLRHYAYYSPEMSRVLVEEQELVSEMVAALEKEEFKVWIQPQFDYATDSLSGAEALVRWKHPAKGMISPATFIPLFERNGFIVQLDEYVWDKVFSLVRRWIDMGINPVPVSVNISRRDIYDSNVPETFRGLLKKYNLTPDRIRLEITESAYMETPEKLIDVVSELQKIGFMVEMDDFGSGYSSLNMLKEVPIDILKLDMKFITDMKSSGEILEKSKSKGGSILTSVIRMASWLKLPVIAEGIETKSQADYLKSIGCFNMQGFYFAKPMPCEEFETFLETIPEINPDISSSSDEIINAVNFLDASTQSTLLFNSFVGGAAIIEWYGTTVEAIRINEQFYQELGTSRDVFEPYRKNLIDSIEGPSRTIFLTNLAEAVRTGEEAFCEIKIHLPSTELVPFWLKVRVRHLAKKISSDIFYLTIENIDFRMHLLEMNTILSEQLAEILETVNCGIETCVYDKNTGKVSVSYLNETCAQIFGYNQAEFRAKMRDNPLLIFSAEEGLNRMNYIKELVKSGKSNFALDIQTLTKDGQPKSISIHGRVAQRSDGLINMVIVFVDKDMQDYFIKK